MVFQSGTPSAATSSSLMPCTACASGVIGMPGLTGVSSRVVPVQASMTAISQTAP
nr:hypothetical protein [Nocardia noduli]